MPNQTLENILAYIETKGATIPLLVDKIKVTKAKEPLPGVCKDYALHVYLGLDKPVETLRTKIGPITVDQWRINCDLVFNRNLKSRELYSNVNGLSYWINLLTTTFMNGNNSGAFKTSSWEFQYQEDDADAVNLKGIFTCEIQNTY